MSRRGRGRRADVAKSIAQRFYSLFLGGSTGDYRFEAGSYTVSGSNAASFIDMISGTRSLAQATGANQCLIPTANADLNNQLTASFSGSMWYDSTESASNWSFRHNGTGYTEVVVFRPTSALAVGILHATVRSQDVNTTTGSILGYRTSGTNGVYWRVCNGTGTRPVEQDSMASAGVSNGTATYIVTSYGSSASPNAVAALKSTTLFSGAQGGTPSAGAPSATLKLGANGLTNDFGFVGEWAATYIFKRALNATERSVVQSYIQQRYRIAP